MINTLNTACNLNLTHIAGRKNSGTKKGCQIPQCSLEDSSRQSEY